ncbi:MAG: ABC transporter permease, partial [Burkholderiales bacterium]|nr:ABC transporter permease [Phycisphaerae bacterium]
MNFFQLILKQIRQRSLSTILTIFSISLGVGLAIAILVIHRESKQLFGQTDYGYEVLAGVKGSGLQLVVNTVYHIDRSPGNIKYSVYESIAKERRFRQDAKIVIPQCVGDSYNGVIPIIGTTPQFFGYSDDGTRVEQTRRFEYRPGRSFEFAHGKVLTENRFEAVIGSDVPRLAGLKLGDTFQATHGFPNPNQPPDVHEEKWTITGVLAPTRTAADKCIYIGLTSFYTIFEHGEAEIQREAARQAGAPKSPVPIAAPQPPTPQPAAPTTKPVGEEKHDEHAGEHEEKHYTMAPDGTIVLDPELLGAREVSAVLIKARSGFGAMNLMFNLNLLPDVMAVNPAMVMREFFANFLDGPVQLLLVISALVIVIAAIGIMTTIYNSVAARSREIAILRALGATRRRILLLITFEAALLGLIGAIIGFILGHAMAAAGSAYLNRTFGEGIAWQRVSPYEIWGIAAVVLIAFFAGLVPALKAYRVPVA